MGEQKTIKRKSQFWWATIAGADCEPVEVATLDGERVAYTCGCGDPFYLDRPDCPLVLVPLDQYNEPDMSMHRPRTPKQERNHEIARKRMRTIAANHSWRGPR